MPPCRDALGRGWHRSRHRRPSEDTANGGWQKVTSAHLYQVMAGKTYVVSYHAPQGRYAVTRRLLRRSQRFGPLSLSQRRRRLSIWQRYGLPGQSYANSNYWVDVVLTADSPAPTPQPTPTPTPSTTDLTILGTAGQDTLAGMNGNDLISGLAGDDTLSGGAGADTLNGGSGVDSMDGGVGDDIYIVDNTGDRVIEGANGGTDLVQSSVSYTLAANVENLTLTGTTSINGTGNALANLLIGNAATNILDGGLGADRMEGGAGNDTYIVDNAGDQVIEASGGGTDKVQSSVSHTLAANVENLTLSGTADLNGTGNSLVNRLVGNVGNNILDGGLGADRMWGDGGNDTYIVDNAGDKVIETANNGTDTVQASVSYSLATDVENLSLTGTANINGTGNGLANIMIGNVGNNTLTGGGGADRLEGGGGNDILLGGTGNDRLAGGSGSDILTGGSGADQFIFASLSDSGATAASRDVITDFTQSHGDRIDLSLLDANQSLSGNQAFKFVGTDAFSGSAGELRYEHSGSVTLALVDVDGDRTADFSIELSTHVSLLAQDFIL